MRILVLDDDPHLVRLLDLRIRRLGHETILAHCPQNALEDEAWKMADAVITDIDMPRMNGIEFANSVKKNRPSMQVVFCTGSSPEGEKFRAAAKIGAVMSKPWKAEDLEKQISNLANLVCD